MNQLWTPVNNILWECPYKFPAGITKSLLLKISEDKYLVYSPGNKETAELAKEIMPNNCELYLLAPNTFHNLGIADWKSVFPNSKFIASKTGHQKLEKKTGHKPDGIEALSGQLPEHINLIELPHNKIGEVWLDIKTPNERIWTVCDAIFNFKKLESGLMGFLMKLNRMGPGLEMSRIYGILGTSNKKAYGQWLSKQIEERKPTQIIPLHGETYKAEDLAHKLNNLVQKRLI